MEIPRSEAEVKDWFGTWYVEWQTREKGTDGCLMAACNVRAMEWMLGFNDHDEAAKWAASGIKKAQERKECLEKLKQTGV